MRRRRYIEAGGLYELTFRARRGLPFPPKQTILLLIKGAIARTQRDSKVYLCHLIWMGNHAHLLVVSKDAKQLVAFYGELKKRITDYMKRLLGYEHLDLWESRDSVVRIADYAAAVERIAYFYANPARANLVETIEKYPGYSSYRALIMSKDVLCARRIETGFWVRCPVVTRLRTNLLSAEEDRARVVMLQKQGKRLRFAMFPHLWLRCFGLTSSEDVRAAKKQVLAELRRLEVAAEDCRRREGSRTVGAKQLIRQSIGKKHAPRKRERRIFVIARDKDVRLEYIEMVKRICDLCIECYLRWRSGDYSFAWPPGTFPPPFPMSANALA